MFPWADCSKKLSECQLIVVLFIVLCCGVHSTNSKLKNSEHISCSSEITKDSKGDFKWEKSIVGQTAFVPCPFGGLLLLDDNNTPQQRQAAATAFATRACLSDGRWSAANTTQCEFKSKSLILIRKLSSGLIFEYNTGAAALETLVNLTSNPDRIQEPIFLHYLSTTIGLLYWQIELDNNLIALTFSVINNVLGINSSVLFEAERLFNACSQLVDFITRSSLKRLSYDTRVLSVKHSRLAVLEHLIIVNTTKTMRFKLYYDGRMSVYRFAVDEFEDEIGPEYVRRKSDAEEEKEEPLLPLAIIEIPSMLFRRRAFALSGVNVRIQAIWMANNNLFPVVNQKMTLQQFYSNSGVIGVATELTDAEYSYLKPPIKYKLLLSKPSKQPVPSLWQPLSSDGHRHGSWPVDQRNCWQASSSGSLTKSYCSHLGYVTVWQPNNENFDDQQVVLEVRFTPWMYISSVLLLLSLLNLALSYCCCSSSVLMSAKLRHCFTNYWLSFSGLLLIFITGASQSFVIDRNVCVGVGVLLQYLLLCTLFWSIIIIRNLYLNMWSRVSPVVESVARLTDAVVSKNAASQGSSLGSLFCTYFVGWFLSLFVCAFSVLLSIDSYVASGCYCFLSPGAAFVAAVVFPVVLLVLATLIVFCTAAFMLRRARRFVSLSISSSTSPKTATTNLESDDSNSIASLLSRVHSDTFLCQPMAIDNHQTSASVEVDDAMQVHQMGHQIFGEQLSLAAQLKYLVIQTLLMWLLFSSAYLFLVKPKALLQLFDDVAKYDVAVSVLYSVVAFALALFLTCNYLIFRQKLRKRWYMLIRHVPQKVILHHRSNKNGNRRTTTTTTEVVHRVLMKRCPTDQQLLLRNDSSIAISSISQQMQQKLETNI